MSIKEQVAQTIEGLGDSDLLMVVDYLAFLKYRSRRQDIAIPDKRKLAALYAEFANEDCELAEQGIDGYVNSLFEEDA